MKDLKIDSGKVSRNLVGFIKQEARKRGFSRAIIGLSGGVDSATIAFLAAKALGPKNVWGVTIPHRSNSKESIRHAGLIIKKLGINALNVDITAQIDAYFSNESLWDRKFPGVSPDVPRDSFGGSLRERIRAGNKMARERMSVLYDLSAKYRALVIGSSNRTELLLGYGTIHGDLACAIMPLGCLYKTQVWQLAEYLGVPGEIIKKPPTADLWHGQTDEGELGFRYKDADRLLFNMVDRKKTPVQLKVMGFNRDFIKNVRDRIKRNAFKRQLPPVPPAC